MNLAELEWLETNGAGAFAMGTVAGVNTRRYHALLVATVRPPMHRYVLLSRLEEEVVSGSETVALSAAQYPGVIAPRGFERIEAFRRDPWPTWRWRAGRCVVEKELFLGPGTNTVVLRYRADAALRLRLRPFLAYRDYHSLSHANGALRGEVRGGGAAIAMQPYDGLPELRLVVSGGRFTADAHWSYNVEYLRERDRGLDFREDLYTPGVFSLDMPPGEWVWLAASADRDVALDAARIDAWRAQASSERVGSSPLDSAARQFLVRRADGSPTVIAGYPWFTDWGRDTMISLPGLLIARGRLEEARQIVRGFLRHRHQGIIPNRFPDDSAQPEYNTADATLWMFVAVWHLWRAAGSDAFLPDEFLPAAEEILDWHQRGTLFGIGADPRDGLLRAGAPGVQLTWMDAKVGDRVVTPRHGKPVEINALWCNALGMMAAWSQAFGLAEAARWQEAFQRARSSFTQAFWNDARGCLFDVLGDDGPDASLRPNQIFAVSLPLPLLSNEQARGVVRVCQQELLTDYGLRSLERGHPDYRPHYGGGPSERDGAYHQGAVWAWLLGPFLSAYRKAFGDTPEVLAFCRQRAGRLLQEATEPRPGGCIGQIAELYQPEPPHEPAGAPAQAWSVAELIRVLAEL